MVTARATSPSAPPPPSAVPGRRSHAGSVGGADDAGPGGPRSPPFRQQIQDYIRAHEGSTYTDVKRNLSLSNGTLTFHLQVLEGQGLVRSRIERGRKLLYSRDSCPPEDAVDDRGGTQGRILSMLVRAPESPLGDVARLLGISRQLVTHHMRLLAAEGRVRLDRRESRLCATLVEEGGPPP